jgi:5,10-methylenetetrahydrofolate reductase
MTKKVAHGAIAIISQPVYDLENARKLLDMMAEANRENVQTVSSFWAISRLPNSEPPAFWMKMFRGFCPSRMGRSARSSFTHQPRRRVSCRI